MHNRPPDALFVPAHVLPLIHPPASLVTVHDLGYLYFPRAHPWRQRLYLDLSTRWNVRDAAHVLADSEATKTDLVARCGAPADKITVAYPGWDETLAPVRDRKVVEAIKARHGIAGRYLLYLGTLQPRKNLARVISAFAAYAEQDADITLVLAGQRGWLYEDLFAQVARLGPQLSQRVHFPGYIPEADKAALLSGALAFVFPSLYEGFGLPVLEAQACGCPIITSAASSLPEAAGDAALYVDPHDTADITSAIARVISEPDLRRDLIERGRHNVRRFSWEACAQTILHTIEGIVQHIQQTGQSVV
jgi:glycosyltransferase involved in cell wall biosynthesis